MTRSWLAWLGILILAVIPQAQADLNDGFRGPGDYELSVERLGPDGKVLSSVHLNCLLEELVDIGAHTLSIRGPEKGQVWTINLEVVKRKDGAAALSVRITDLSLLQRVNRENGFNATPRTIFETTTRFDKKGEVVVYRTDREQMRISLRRTANIDRR